MNVAVVIATRNRPGELDRCLASLAVQTVAPAAIVVVDSGRQSLAADVVERFAGVLRDTRWLPFERASLPAQRNAGVAALSPGTEIVLFLDDDVELEPDYIERLLDVFRGDNEGRVGGVAGVSLQPVPQRQRWWFRLWRRTFVLGLLEPAPPGSVTRGGVNLPIDSAAAGPQAAEWLFGCAAYRRELLLADGFDEQLEGSALMEDVDFSFRVGRSRSLVVTPLARLVHHQSPINRASAGRLARDFVRNRHWFLRKNRWSSRTAVAFWWTTAGYALLWSARALLGSPTARSQLAGALAGASDVLLGRFPEVAPRFEAPAPRIAVAVATVGGREEQLRRCLAGLAAQTRPPDEIVVVRDRQSYVAGLRAAWSLCDADWIAFLDDDAVPQSSWLERIEPHLVDPRLGAVGGRVLDVIAGRTTAGTFDRGPVASLSWYGRTVSRLHDLPAAALVCEVDFLPGSNICIRRAALGEVDQLLDDGMAPGFELAVCQRLRRRGWTVRYDSEILVTHYPAPRPPELRREDRVRYAREYSRTLVLALLRELPWLRKLAFLLYFTLVGQRESPGLALAPYFLLPGRSRSRLAAAWRGRWEGLVACASRS